MRDGHKSDIVAHRKEVRTALQYDMARGESLTDLGEWETEDCDCNDGMLCVEAETRKP